MRGGKYPLEAAARVRSHMVDEGARVLASAVSAREAAEASRATAEADVRGHQLVVAKVDGTEASALAAGELRVADLATAQTWRLGSDARLRALAEAASSAQSAVLGAARVEEGARVEVASRRADARVIEDDRARWAAARLRAEELADEEAAAEASLGRR